MSDTEDTAPAHLCILDQEEVAQLSSLLDEFLTVMQEGGDGIDKAKLNHDAEILIRVREKLGAGPTKVAKQFYTAALDLFAAQYQDLVSRVHHAENLKQQYEMHYEALADTIPKAEREERIQRAHERVARQMSEANLTQAVLKLPNGNEVPRFTKIGESVQEWKLGEDRIYLAGALIKRGPLTVPMDASVHFDCSWSLSMYIEKAFGYSVFGRGEQTVLRAQRRVCLAAAALVG